jgi:hypothetical protein
MAENWTPTYNYEDNYLVSDLGRIKSLKTNKILKSIDHNQGYLYVNLYSNRKGKPLLVHRLVLQSFTEDHKREVNHKNGDKKDNRLINLEWVSSSENKQHRYQTLSKSQHGVSWKKDRNKWKAYYYIKGKQIHLGYFNTKKEALEARKKGVEHYKN